MKRSVKGVNTVLYGKPGTGKTTLACTFPGPVLLLDISEEGTDSVVDIKGLKTISISSWDEVQDTYWYLKKANHGFKTVVWDTVSQVQDLYIIELLREKNRDVDNPGGWGTMTRQMWGEVSNKMKMEILNWRNLEGINVVFIAHNRVFTPGGDDEDMDENEEILPSVGPRVMPSVASTLNAAVNIIGNTFVRQKIRPKKKLKGGKVIPEKKSVQYGLRIGPNAVYETKMRKPKKYMLPDVIIDPSYEKIMAIQTGE